jgi:ligand-binding SRPBCC domain-containing protein
VGKLYVLQREQLILCPIQQVFEFFADVQNLEAITPPWLNFKVLSKLPIEMRQDAEIEYQLSWRFIGLHWKTLIRQWEPPHFFVDVQMRGPYKLWEHTHSFRPDNGGTRMLDTVRYELPFGVLGSIAHAIKVRRDLDRIFDFRAATIDRLFRERCQPT